jgi:CheY-like chemotaxis protein
MNNAQVEILLVEDNLNDATLAIRALTKSKMINNLIHLNDGAEALDFLYGSGKFIGRDTLNFPKVILLDLKMPKVDGWEVLQKIKSDEKLKAIPVVVLTSSKESPDIEKCYRLGANSYIVKPVVFDNFIKAVQDIGLYWVLLNEPAAKK